MTRKIASLVIGVALVGAALLASTSPAHARACWGSAPCIPVGMIPPPRSTAPPAPSPKAPKPPVPSLKPFIGIVCGGEYYTVCGPRSARSITMLVIVIPL